MRCGGIAILLGASDGNSVRLYNNVCVTPLTMSASSPTCFAFPSEAWQRDFVSNVQ
jgi:hypothetical protein